MCKLNEMLHLSHFRSARGYARIEKRICFHSLCAVLQLTLIVVNGAELHQTKPMGKKDTGTHLL